MDSTTDWSPVITQQSFTYANLPYGEYSFEVIASIDGKNWSDPAQFSFTIKKPYYLSWWFFLIAGIVIAQHLLRCVEMESKYQQAKKSN